MESLKSEVSILQGKRSASEEIKENLEDEEQDEEEGRRLSSSLQVTFCCQQNDGISKMQLAMSQFKVGFKI